jgi:hypothetical protein
VFSLQKRVVRSWYHTIVNFERQVYLNQAQVRNSSGYACVLITGRSHLDLDLELRSEQLKEYQDVEQLSGLFLVSTTQTMLQCRLSACVLSVAVVAQKPNFELLVKWLLQRCLIVLFWYLVVSFIRRMTAKWCQLLWPMIVIAT